MDEAVCRLDGFGVVAFQFQRLSYVICSPRDGSWTAARLQKTPRRASLRGELHGRVG